MKYKSKVQKRYHTICCILEVNSNKPDTGVINILLVLYGIRPAYWYDGPKLTQKQLFNLLTYLHTWKRYGIYYKFDDGTHHLREGTLIQEGPLIYNHKHLTKELLKQIETVDVADTYQLPIFGKILGYSCQVDIYDKEIRNSGRTVRYAIQGKEDGVHYIYSFICSRGCLTPNIRQQINVKRYLLNSLIQKYFRRILSRQNLE